MDNYNDHLEALLEHRNGLSVHSIHFVKREIIDLTADKQLEAIGLKQLSPIYFSIRGEGYCDNGLLNQGGKGMKGVTLNVTQSNYPRQIILIQDDVPPEDGLNSELQIIWENIMKLSALAHELGHVEDMQKREGSNFTYDPPQTNLVEAEAYAHSYCLNYLHRSGLNLARDTIASSLYKMVKSNKKFEQQLFKSICNRIGKGRVKKWASV